MTEKAGNEVDILNGEIRVCQQLRHNERHFNIVSRDHVLALLGHAVCPWPLGLGDPAPSLQLAANVPISHNHRKHVIS